MNVIKIIILEIKLRTDKVIVVNYLERYRASANILEKNVVCDTTFLTSTKGVLYNFGKLVERDKGSFDVFTLFTSRSQTKGKRAILSFVDLIFILSIL